MASASIPDEFLDQMAEKFRSLADPTRLAILRSLMQGERNVTQMIEKVGGSQANISKHLKVLSDAGMVTRRKVGLQVFYALDDPLVERLCRLVCETIVAEAEKELERHNEMLDKWRSGP